MKVRTLNLNHPAFIPHAAALRPIFKFLPFFGRDTLEGGDHFGVELAACVGL